MLGINNSANAFSMDALMLNNAPQTRNGTQRPANVAAKQETVLQIMNSTNQLVNANASKETARQATGLTDKYANASALGKPARKASGGMLTCADAREVLEAVLQNNVILPNRTTTQSAANANAPFQGHAPSGNGGMKTVANASDFDFICTHCFDRWVVY